jgi:enediyne biosynthesis protein E4
MREASLSGFVVSVGTTNFLFVVAQAIGAPAVVSDQSISAGLQQSHAQVFNGPDMEFMAAGGAAGDFDNDGDQDLFVLGGSASADHLYINDGSGNFSDIGVQAGIARTHQGTGVAVGDFDNDGDLDVYVTSLGEPGNRVPGACILWSNNGDNTFTDVTASAGVAYTSDDLGDAYSASFGDYDLDGDLDLAVAGWLGGSRLYMNNNDGTFADVTSVALDTSLSQMRGFSPRFVDMDGDRYPELLWVSDFYTSEYFVNNTDGTFTNQTTSSGTGLDSNGMGNTFGDYDNDGLLDWYVTSRINREMTNGSGNMLYRASGIDHVYSEVSVETGSNNGYWGWAAVSVDMNHDGFLDIFETNGFTGTFETDPSILFLNDGFGNFVDIASESGMNDNGQGRGLINADFDLDGDQDIVVLNNSQPMVYYRNDLSGIDTNSITLLFNTDSIEDLAPNGIGTRVLLESDSFSQVRYLDGGTNYLSQSELSVHAGLSTDESVDLTILWANGEMDVFPNVAPGRYTIRAISCAADLSGDGVVNFFDISAFLTLFSSEHPQADLTGDGVLNFFDISGFLSDFAQGCP